MGMENYDNYQAPEFTPDTQSLKEALTPRDTREMAQLLRDYKSGEYFEKMDALFADMKEDLDDHFDSHLSGLNKDLSGYKDAVGKLSTKRSESIAKLVTLRASMRAEASAVIAEYARDVFGTEEAVQEYLGLPKYRADEVVFIGDSQVRLRKRSLDQLGIGSIARSGFTISKVQALVAKTLKRNPRYFEGKKLIYLHAGGNDVWYRDLEKMKADVLAFKDYLSDVAPHVRVVMGTITPRESRIAGIERRKPKRGAAIRQRLDSFNAWVLSEFGDNAFDAHTAMEDPEREGYQNPEFASKDRLHFNREGYAHFTGEILDEFGIGEARSPKEKVAAEKDALEDTVWKVKDNDDYYVTVDGVVKFKSRDAMRKTTLGQMYDDEAIMVNGRLAVRVDAKKGEYYYVKKNGRASFVRAKVYSKTRVSTHIPNTQRERMLAALDSLNASV